MTTLDAFIAENQAFIFLGCAAVILLPSLFILGVVSATEWLRNAILRRPAVTPEAPSEIPAAPTTVMSSDIDGEWADIELEMEKSK